MRAQKGRSSSNESKAWMNLCFSGSDFRDVEDGMSMKYLVDKNLIDIVLNRIKTEGKLKVFNIYKIYIIHIFKTNLKS